jgi:hypothetical protein
MKSVRLPCENAYMGIDRVRAAAGNEFSASATVSHSGLLRWIAHLRILTIPEYISKNMGTSQDLWKSVELGE